MPLLEGSSNLSLTAFLLQDLLPYVPCPRPGFELSYCVVSKSVLVFPSSCSVSFLSICSGLCHGEETGAYCSFWQWLGWARGAFQGSLQDGREWPLPLPLSWVIPGGQRVPLHSKKSLHFNPLPVSLMFFMSTGLDSVQTVPLMNCWMTLDNLWVFAP